jgi:hypothetical protein
MSAPAATPIQAVQCFGRKKTAVAVAYCKKGKGILKLNGSPIELIQPELLRYKVFEPVLLLGAERFAQVDIRIRCKGGGYTSQIYAIRQVGACFEPIGLTSAGRSCCHRHRLPHAVLARASAHAARSHALVPRPPPLA